MKITIIYFPGFGGDENSTTLKHLKTAFPKAIFYCMQYDNIDPIKAKLALDYQLKTIDYKTKAALYIGNSLGGYWANLMAQEINLPCVLINPSLFPQISLQKYNIHVGHLANYEDSTNYIVPRLLFLSKHDTVVDYKKTISFFEEEYETIFLEEDHRIQNFEPVINGIKKFVDSPMLLAKEEIQNSIFHKALVANAKYAYNKPAFYNEMLHERKDYYNKKFERTTENIQHLVALDKEVKQKEKAMLYQYLQLMEVCGRFTHPMFDYELEFEVQLYSDKVFYHNDDNCGTDYATHKLFYFNDRAVNLSDSNANFDLLYQETIVDNYNNRFNHEPFYKELAKYQFCETMQQIIIYSTASLVDLLQTKSIWLVVKLVVQNRVKL